MCMLMGYIVKDESTMPKLLRYFDLIDWRGRDAFGLWTPEYGKKVFTSKMDLVSFISVRKPKIALAVARAIPATERVHTDSLEKDTQPFSNGTVVVTHNGLLSNDVLLRKQYGSTAESKVDTAVMPDVITAMIGETFYSPLFFKRIFSEVLGSYAFVWYDVKRNCLCLMKNFMPLHYVKTEDYFFWSSLSLGSDFQSMHSYSYMLVNGTNLAQMLYSRVGSQLDPRKVVVVCSGGLDSVTTARLYQVLGYDVVLLHFLYGQAAQDVEDFVTTRISQHLGLPKLKIDVRESFGHASKSVLLSQLTGDNQLRLFDAESTYSYVGARNLIFASFAMGVAESIGAGKVAFGLNLDDSPYPDNNIDFITLLDSLSGYSLDRGNYLRVCSPFVHLTKKEIIEVGIAIGSPFELQASCYYPKLVEDRVVACGECGCDFLRQCSFEALGWKDPILQYDEKSTLRDLFEYEPYLLRREMKEISPEYIPYLKYMHL